MTSWPKVIEGSHSTRTEYEDGSVDFTIYWDQLAKDVSAAIATVGQPIKKKRNRPKKK